MPARATWILKAHPELGKGHAALSGNQRLAAVKIQKDLIGRENQLGLVEVWMVFDRSPAKDLHGDHSLLVIRESFDQLAGCVGHGGSVAKAGGLVK